MTYDWVYGAVTGSIALLGVLLGLWMGRNL